MARDFSDYILLIFGAWERTTHYYHLRQLRKDPEIKEFDHNEYTYLVNKDRAMRIRGWKPWKKWDKARPLHSFAELLRSKKVGLIVYREPIVNPPKTRLIRKRVPVSYTCKECGFQRDKVGPVKTHIKRKHKTGNANNKIVVEFKNVTEKELYRTPIEPLHISRIHQPSGEMDKPPEGNLKNILTPRLLKVECEDDSYRKAYKSYKFGKLVPITAKWWIWVLVAVVVAFFVLFFMGRMGMM